MDKIAETITHLVKYIRLTREKKSYSQEYMAAKLKISQNAYSKIELGMTTLTLERLLEIAAILQTDIHELVRMGQIAAIR